MPQLVEPQRHTVVIPCVCVCVFVCVYLSVSVRTAVCLLHLFLCNSLKVSAKNHNLQALLCKFRINALLSTYAHLEGCYQ